MTVRPHVNADRLQVATFNGVQVVVGMEVKDGDLGVFFPTDGQLSENFATRHDLVGKYVGGIKVGGGYFDPRRRVRSQNFRGEKSEGFWVPISYFDYADFIKFGNIHIKLEDACQGLGFDTVVVAGVEEPVCCKYITEATQRARQGGKKERRSKVATYVFPEHQDTENLGRNIHKIKSGDLVMISRKLHGTSGRFGNVWLEEKREIPLVSWLSRKLFGKEVVRKKSGYSHHIGSRRVVIDGSKGPGHYGTNEFRYDAVYGVQLHEGEVIYFEIVGWVNLDTPIMSPQPIKDKAMAKAWNMGPFPGKMSYTYGCPVGTHEVYVYRITKTSPDGHEVDYSWSQVVGRCRELGLKTVPVIDTYFFDGNASDLLNACIDYANGPTGRDYVPDTIDGSHIQEGVVVRVDSADGGTFFLKEKSFAFGVLEGYIKDDDNYVDTEEAA